MRTRPALVRFVILSYLVSACYWVKSYYKLDPDLEIFEEDGKLKIIWDNYIFQDYIMIPIILKIK